MDLHNPVILESTLATIGDEQTIEETFATLVERRIGFEPLQYLTGTAPFRHLEIEVGPGVLVPRPESELLVASNRRRIFEIHAFFHASVQLPRH